jgi:hypothetical protein
MLKYVFILSILVNFIYAESVLESQFDSTNDYKLYDQEEIDNNTKIRNFHNLKKEQFQIIEIIRKFNVLENSLTGFEERKVVGDLKNFFRNKYFINNKGSMKTYNRLNEIIDFIDKENEL